MDDFDFLDNPIEPVDNDVIGTGVFHPMSHSDWINFQSDLINREIDMNVFHPTMGDNMNTQDFHPTFEQDSDNGGVIVTDIFSHQHHYASMEEASMLTDVFSGIPISSFSHTTDNCSFDTNDDASEVDDRSLDRMKLDKSNDLTQQRDYAVEQYKDAKSRHDYNEAAKWAAVANEKQGALQTLWNRGYSLDPKAPGID